MISLIFKLLVLILFNCVLTWQIIINSMGINKIVVIIEICVVIYRS